MDTMDATDGLTPWPVLALNSGSSSFKFGLYRVQATSACPVTVETLMSDSIDSIDAGNAHATIADISERITQAGLPAPVAIGHRIVHGGPALRQHSVVDAAVMAQIAAAAPFAPLHTATALAALRAAQQHFSGVPHVACFDTVFHASMPDMARVLPIPATWQQEGIRRYGFHGLSCESILHKLGDGLPIRVIVAHLGHGASITAIHHGQSVDTSMGLTPSGGVIMGTRSGDLDPGILIYLVRRQKLDGEMLETLLDHQSGLLGISGISSDMRRLHDAAHTDASARLAIRMFCASVAKQIAAMITVLDGVDLIVFTGGIGENDAPVRSEICSRLSWMGVNLDEPCNQSLGQAVASGGDAAIHSPASRCQVRVMASREDLQIARHTWALTRPL